MTHTAAVSLAGGRACNALRANRGGTVLSSHLSGLYCRMDDGAIILVHNEGYGLIPFGMGCAPPLFAEGWKAVAPGTTISVSWTERTMVAGDFAFAYGGASSALPEYPWHGKRPDLAALRRGVCMAAERVADPSQGIAAAFLERRKAFFAGMPPEPPLEDFWEKALWEPLQRLVMFCLPPANHDAMEQGLPVGPLIGLGPGLTPLADDVLCGLFAAGFALKTPFPCAALALLTETLAPATARGAKEMTTTQSVAFLQSAAAGERFGMLDALMAATYEGCTSAFDAARDASLNVGHSSGSGLALGVFLAMEIAARGMAHGDRDARIL